MSSDAFLQLRNRLRSGGTQRFHTHADRMIKTQDVAQHSYNVVWLVMALTVGCASRQLIVAALEHDAVEHWVGDLPAPTKRTLNIREQFGELEDKVGAEQFGHTFGAQLGLVEAKILRLADALEGAFRCVHEIDMGNRLMYGVLENFRSYARTEFAANPTLLKTAGFHFDFELFEEIMVFLEGITQ